MTATRVAALLLPLSFVAVYAADSALPSVDEIVQKNTEARGGRDRIRAIQTIKLVGTAQINGNMQAAITLQTKRPDLFRLDLNIGASALVQAFDGTDAWTINPFTGGGVPQKQTASESRTARENSDMDGPLLDYKAKGSKVELLGVEDVAGNPAYHLRITTKSGMVSNVWIDQKTWHEAKMTQTHQQNGQDLEVTILFSNFKSVNGVSMPFTHEQQIGRMSMKIEFASAEANVPIDDAIFQMPAAAPPSQTAPVTPK